MAEIDKTLSGVPDAPENCSAAVEFANKDGSMSGKTACPYRGKCALEAFRILGYRTDLEHGRCACGFEPTSTEDIFNN